MVVPLDIVECDLDESKLFAVYCDQCNNIARLVPFFFPIRVASHSELAKPLLVAQTFFVVDLVRLIVVYPFQLQRL